MHVSCSESFKYCSEHIVEIVVKFRSDENINITDVVINGSFSYKKSPKEVLTLRILPLKRPSKVSVRVKFGENYR